MVDRLSCAGPSQSALQNFRERRSLFPLAIIVPTFPLSIIPWDDSEVKTPCSPYVVCDRERRLTNAEQLAVLRATVARGAAWRGETRGHSMRPAIRDGDIVTVVPHVAAPRIGDIMAFRHPRNGRLVIHRIAAQKDAGWLMRGDNCLSDDGIVPAATILGRVTRIERRGGRRLRRKLAVRLARLWRRCIIRKIAP